MTAITPCSTANSPRLEVRSQPRRRLFRCRERDITIRPQKVECVSLKTGALHRRLPAELVQREVALGACRTDLRGRITVNVHLPLERGQRREVVCAASQRIERYPWQPIAAVDTAGPPFTQCAPAIVDRCLREPSSRSSSPTNSVSRSTSTPASINRSISSPNAPRTEDEFQARV